MRLKFKLRYLFLIGILIICACVFIVFLLKSRRGKYFKKEDKKAIIFIGGIGCSTLHYLGETNSEYKYGECVFFRGDFKNWGFLELKDCAIKTLKNYKYLSCDRDGNSKYSYIGLLDNYDGVDEHDVRLSKYGFCFMYEKIINFCKNKYGLGTNYNYDVFLFNYDWRLSNKFNGRRLVDVIKKYPGGVIIVAFSMGNLVFSNAATILYNEKKLDLVKLFISTYPPYCGSIDAILFLKTGILDMTLFHVLNKIYKLDLILRSLTLNYPSMYELIPTKEFFRRRKGFLINDDKSRLNYRQSLSYLRNDQYINKKLLSDAVAFHSSLYIKGKHILEFVKNKYFFLGVGHKTPDRLLIDKKDLNKIEVVSYSDGDGTVNYSNSAYPPCTVDEEDIINISKEHNSLYFDSDFLMELSDVLEMYI